ncbi:GntR family transcriptional regulator [Roseovarius aestuarii]|nr:GntR family transcriptional regulator [Roseovarius aestuarii]
MQGPSGQASFGQWEAAIVAPTDSFSYHFLNTCIQVMFQLYDARTQPAEVPMSFQSHKPRVDDIADSIRKRICLQPAREQTALLEGTLAAEFGVSRTPVRQALQRLAYEGLIEIRTGVGSIVVPLDPTDRDLHFAVHRGIFRLVAALPDAPVPVDIELRFDTLTRQAQVSSPSDRMATYALLVRLNETLSRLIPDQVVADAFVVSGWRILRWFLMDQRSGDPLPTEALSNLCSSLLKAAPHGRSGLFTAGADLL